MNDRNELQALKSSYRGALATAASLSGLAAKIDALATEELLSQSDFEELARVTLAHAVAAQALRGLVETMRATGDRMNAAAIARVRNCVVEFVFVPEQKKCAAPGANNPESRGA